MTQRSCAWCKIPLVLDRLTTAAGHPPRERDVTICAVCNGVGVMHNGQWQIPTADEKDELMQDKRFLKALAQSIADAVERNKNKRPN